MCSGVLFFGYICLLVYLFILFLCVLFVVLCLRKTDMADVVSFILCFVWFVSWFILFLSDIASIGVPVKCGQLYLYLLYLFVVLSILFYLWFIVCKNQIWQVSAFLSNVASCITQYWYQYTATLLESGITILFLFFKHSKSDNENNDNEDCYIKDS